jgi:two-component system competent response regulator ComA
MPMGLENRVKVLIVDDHPTVGYGTQMILGSQEMIGSIRVARSGKEAMKQAETDPPDIVFLDLFLPDISGLAVAEHIKTRNADTHIIIFTAQNYIPMFNKLVRIGVSGILTKDAAPEQIVRMLECVLRKETVIPLELFWRLQMQKGRSPSCPLSASLTEKEEHILDLVGQGLTNREISQKMYMTARNVEYYLSRIYEKLNVRSRAEAIEKYNKLYKNEC